MSCKNAVILAAGRGSRLAPDGSQEEHSKPLIEVEGKTLLEHTVDACRAAGVETIYVVTGFHHKLVREKLSQIDQGDLVEVFNEEWDKSNGVSVLVCQKHLREPFLLMMSDHLFDIELLKGMANQELSPQEVILAVDFKVDSVFDLDDATKVLVGDDTHVNSIGKQISEYNAIDCGVFLCSPFLFEALQTAYAEKGDCSLSEGVAVVSSHKKFRTWDIGGLWWQDVDTPEMLAEAKQYLARQK